MEEFSNETPMESAQAAPMQQQAPQGPSVPMPSMTYAGFWIRFVAAIIDGIVLYIVGFIVGIILGIAMGSSDPMSVASVSTVISVIVQIAYFTFMESSAHQGTVGKIALGLKVQDLHGNRLSSGKALVRTLGKFVSSIILLLGYIMAGFTSKKQGLHDMIAGTVVVKK